jgi:hypothetical protein
VQIPEREKLPSFTRATTGCTLLGTGTASSLLVAQSNIPQNTALGEALDVYGLHSFNHFNESQDAAAAAGTLRNKLDCMEGNACMLR